MFFHFLSVKKWNKNLSDGLKKLKLINENPKTDAYALLLRKKVSVFYGFPLSISLRFFPRSDS